MQIRPATAADLPAILAIYNEVILNSTAVYRDEPFDLANRQAWFAERQARGWPVLVAEVDGLVAGFASYGDFRSYPGYRFTVEHSVHLAPAFRGHGIGSRLVEALLPLAAAQGLHVMVASIDAENQGSIRFHEKLGFTEVARMPEVGFKFGRWLDMVLMQRRI